jgi:flagellar motor switch protein FliN/FliY
MLARSQKGLSGNKDNRNNLEEGKKMAERQKEKKKESKKLSEQDNEVIQPDFKELNEETEKQLSNGKDKGIDFLLDIPLTFRVELGRTRMLIKDLLQLGQGSVIELDKIAGEPMEIFVNDKLIARGEVVVVNEKFGIRVTDILSLTERVRQLR